MVLGDVPRRLIRHKVVGVSVGGRQEVVRSLVAGQRLVLVLEPENPVHANAVMVLSGTLLVGYLPRELADEVSHWLRLGESYECVVSDVTGRDRSFAGCNILLRLQEKGKE